MQVAFSIHKDKHRLIKQDDIFSFNPKKRFHWLQYLCLWILAKLGCQYWMADVQTVRLAQGKKTLTQMVLEQQHHLLKYFDREPKELLIGAEDYSIIMGEDSVIKQFIEFDDSYEIGSGSRGYERYKICGLKVKIVPWMKGILVMP